MSGGDFPSPPWHPNQQGPHGRPPHCSRITVPCHALYYTACFYLYSNTKQVYIYTPPELRDIKNTMLNDFCAKVEETELNWVRSRDLNIWANPSTPSST
jgi:hypothetical protein